MVDADYKVTLKNRLSAAGFFLQAKRLMLFFPHRYDVNGTLFDLGCFILPTFFTDFRGGHIVFHLRFSPGWRLTKYRFYKQVRNDGRAPYHLQSPVF